jgi:hypothetical protein
MKRWGSCNTDPQGLIAKYRFEYGTSTEYGSSAPVPDAAAGEETTGLQVGTGITGLQPVRLTISARSRTVLLELPTARVA